MSREDQTLKNDLKILAALSSGKYTVTPDGRVFNNSFQNTGEKREVAYSLHSSGYISIHIGGKTVKRSRVVCLAFYGAPKEYLETNHKNGNKADDSASNLEWVTRSQNSRHAIETGLQPPMKGAKNGNALLTDEVVAEILKVWAEGTLPAREIAARFNVAENTVKCVVKGQSWKHAYTGKVERARRGSQGGEFHPNHKLTAESVSEIKRSIRDGEKLSVIAAKYGVRSATISCIKRGISWRHIP